MNKGMEVLNKANEINQFHDNLPQVQIGDVVKLGVVWDGNGEVPEDSYSYLLTHDGEDGDSNIDVNINYVFEIQEINEDLLYTVVRITDIELT